MQWKPVVITLFRSLHEKKNDNLFIGQACQGIQSSTILISKMLILVFAIKRSTTHIDYETFLYFIQLRMVCTSQKRIKVKIL